MATLFSKEPDVELKDVGSVEARFLTARAKEWARFHHIPNEFQENNLASGTIISGNPGDGDETYCHRFVKTDVEGLIGRIVSSGLTVRRDPKLSSCENLRWINTY